MGIQAGITEAGDGKAEWEEHPHLPPDNRNIGEIKRMSQKVDADISFMIVDGSQ